MTKPLSGHPTRIVKRVAVVGGGWAGLAAAVHAAHDGHHVTVFEASRHWGGRARSLAVTLPDGSQATLDNGQHILIGAYTETLRLMKMVGVDPAASLLRTPLMLSDPRGNGLRLPNWPGLPAWLSALLPVDVLSGVLTARGWSLRDKVALLWTATRWQLSGFNCASDASVADLCRGLPRTLMDSFIEPLCVSALNTPANRASGQVFLRVLKDSLFGVRGGSNLLLPTVDLGALFPDAAVKWLQQPPRNAHLRLGTRVTRLQAESSHTTDKQPGGWWVNAEHFDHVVWSNSDLKAPSALINSDFCATENELQAWSAKNTGTLHAQTTLAQWQYATSQLRHEAIATVFAWHKPIMSAAPATDTQRHLLPQAMTALWPNAQHPAQFVFDRSWLGGPLGLLAFVVSASKGDAHSIAQQVCEQATSQLGLNVTPVKTVVEKRATFACTPGLERPAMHMAPQLMAAGDHVQGPYPATLEGAVRSGWAAASRLNGCWREAV